MSHPIVLHKAADTIYKIYTKSYDMKLFENWKTMDTAYVPVEYSTVIYALSTVFQFSKEVADFSQFVLIGPDIFMTSCVIFVYIWLA